MVRSVNDSMQQISGRYCCNQAIEALSERYIAKLQPIGSCFRRSISFLCDKVLVLSVRVSMVSPKKFIESKQFFEILENS